MMTQCHHVPILVPQNPTQGKTIFVFLFRGHMGGWNGHTDVEAHACIVLILLYFEHLNFFFEHCKCLIYKDILVLFCIVRNVLLFFE